MKKISNEIYFRAFSLLLLIILFSSFTKTRNIRNDDSELVTIQDRAKLTPYIYVDPNLQYIAYTGGETDTFDIVLFDIDDWEIGSILPEWIDIADSSHTYHYIIFDITENTSDSIRESKVIIQEKGNASVADTLTILQGNLSQSFLMVSPEFQIIDHTGGETEPFYIIYFNINGWEIGSIIPDWITHNPKRTTDSITFTIEPNNNEVYREASIVIREIGNPNIADTLKIIQGATVQPLLYANPKEHFVGPEGQEHLVSEIVARNISGWQADNFDNLDWIEVNPSGEDVLDLAISPNDSLLSRTGLIRIFATNADSIADTITVNQFSLSEPFMTLDPISKFGISGLGDTFNILAYSNIDNYSVSSNKYWCRVSPKEGSDSTTIQVIIFPNANYLSSREAEIRFKLDTVNVKVFNLSQLPAEEFFPVSGIVTNTYGEGIEGIEVKVGSKSTITQSSGIFNDSVLAGWTGSIVPIIKNYYFDPFNWTTFQPVQESIGYDSINDSWEIHFDAYKIDPKVALSNAGTINICEEDTLSSENVNYPTVYISGTYQFYTVIWKADSSGDANSISNPYQVYPEFYPTTKTTYTIILSNRGKTDSAKFTIDVNPRPTARDFSGELEVCKNQAGVIYSANHSSIPGEYYSWHLPENGGTFETLTNTNIAIVKWGNIEGKYPLALKTHDEYGCPASVFTDTVIVTLQEAPDQTMVYQKGNDNVLYCEDNQVDSCVWGWFDRDGTGLGEANIIQGKHDWFVRLPEGHQFNPSKHHYFVVTYYDSLPCGSRSFLNPPLDIAEVHEGRISVFPNPTNGLINIRFDKITSPQFGILQLFTISGKLIYQEELNLMKNNTTISIQRGWQQENGIYILLLRTDDYFIHTKIVVR